jgi:hypothetical protein
MLFAKKLFYSTLYFRQKGVILITEIKRQIRIFFPKAAGSQ